jgi:hypothetical protein
MVERVNRTIKSSTILASDYKNAHEMGKDLVRFLVFYNLYRRHGSLRKELRVKTPFDALTKWFAMEPHRFRKTPEELKIYLQDINRNLTP